MGHGRETEPERAVDDILGAELDAIAAEIPAEQDQLTQATEEVLNGYMHGIQELGKSGSGSSPG